MARDVRDIVFRFVGESRDLQRATSQAERGIGGIRDGMKKVAGLAAGAFAVSSIVDFGKAAIDAASDYNESVNAVEVATGDAADEILALGDVAAESFGISKRELNEAAVQLDGFLEKLNEPQEDTFGDIIQAATDFGSVMNITTDEALAKFRSALAGESEPLRNFGKDLSAAAVSAHAVATGISETGKNMTEAEKVQARYSLLMQEMAEYQGDFARTSDSAAGQTKILEARLADLQAELGQKLLPAYTDLLEAAVDMAPALGEVAKAAAEAVGNIGNFTGAVQSASDSSNSWAKRIGDTQAGLLRWIGTIPLLGNPLEALAERVDRIGESSEDSDKNINDFFSSIVENLPQAAAKINETEQAAADLREETMRLEASRVEEFSRRTQDALGDVIGAYNDAREAASLFRATNKSSLDTALGVGDDRPSERGTGDSNYTKRNGTTPSSS